MREPGDASRGGAERQLRRFVIFGLGRSGSSLLADMLNSQPAVVCDFFASPEPVRDPYAAMCSRAAQAAAWGVSAYGARLLVPHLVSGDVKVDVPGLLARARADDWAVIYSRRSSLLRVAISYVHATNHGFHLRPEDGPWRYEPMTIRMEDLSQWLTLVLQWSEIERLALDGTSFLEVVYERDLTTEADQQATVARIMESLLDAPASPVRSAFRRQLPTDEIAELVTNYAEVLDFLQETGRPLLSIDDRRDKDLESQ